MISTTPKKIKYDSTDSKAMAFVIEHKDEELRAMDIVKGVHGENFTIGEKTKLLRRIRLLGECDYLNVKIDERCTTITLGSRKWEA
jgi:hypothetical protein